MESAPQQDVTTLLAAIQAGKQDATNKVAELVYPELRRMAEPLMRNERSDHTLQPSALAHESLLRLL